MYEKLISNVFFKCIEVIMVSTIHLCFIEVCNYWNVQMSEPWKQKEM